MIWIGLTTAALVLGLLANPSNAEVASLQFVPCEASFLSGHDECLKITYKSGDRIEYAGLKYFDEEFTRDAMDGPIFTADGQEIANSDVSVTRDDKDEVAEVMITNPKNDKRYAFQLDLSTGELTPIDGTFDGAETDEPL